LETQSYGFKFPDNTDHRVVFDLNCQQGPPSLSDVHGLFHDDAGRRHIVDLEKGMIFSDGFNVFPQDCAVLKPGAAAAANDLIQFAKVLKKTLSEPCCVGRERKI